MISASAAIRGGSLLVRPELRELARRLGLGTTPERLAYDTVIIGGGPAGLAAAVYGHPRPASRSEARFVQGQDVFLIGAGNSAGQAALHFSNFARTVTVVCRGESLAKSMSYYLIEQLRTKSNISMRFRSEIVFIGADAATDWLPLEIARDSQGFILTGNDAAASGRWSESREPFLLETSVPGIFACGDVRCRSVKRVASGVGEGSMSIAFIHQYLMHAGV